MIELNYGGHTYEVNLTRTGGVTNVRIDMDGVPAGTGTLSPKLRIDCAADLGEDVYEALETEIKDYFSRGFGAEFDPS